MDTSLVEPIEDFDPLKRPDSTITRGWLEIPIGLDGGARLPVMVARGSRPGRPPCSWPGCTVTSSRALLPYLA